MNTSLAKALTFGILLSMVAVVPGFISGCCQSTKYEPLPSLAYLVAYSILDNRFQTSTRLDLTADILNGTDEDLEMVQLVLSDVEGTEYTLDYQTVSSLAQVGRYNAIPLKAPISNMELLGTPGIEHQSAGEMHFLFAGAFESAVIKYRNSNGLQEVKIENLAAILEKSRLETIEWMKKEYEQREKTLQNLKNQVASLKDKTQVFEKLRNTAEKVANTDWDNQYQQEP